MPPKLMNIIEEAFVPNALGLIEKRKEFLDLLQAQCLATHDSQALGAVKGPCGAVCSSCVV